MACFQEILNKASDAGVLWIDKYSQRCRSFGDVSCKYEDCQKKRQFVIMILQRNKRSREINRCYINYVNLRAWDGSKTPSNTSTRMQHFHIDIISGDAFIRECIHINIITHVKVFSTISIHRVENTFIKVYTLVCMCVCVVYTCLSTSFSNVKVFVRKICLRLLK